MSDSRKSSQRRLNDLVYSQLFQLVPFNIAIIDRNYNIIKANRNFEEYFGSWKGKKCYKVYKKLDHPCEDCNSLLTFEDGKTRVIDGVGIDKDGRQAHYIVHIAPLKSSKSKQIDYIVEMSSDITETKRWQKEYQVLFDRVPCYITVIDKNYKIIRANESFRENFGDVTGEQCYSVYKHRKRKCPNCPAAKTFKDGQIHHSNQVGIKKAGEKTHYVVTTSPLGRGEEEVAHVIEISTDITATKKLESEVIEAERLAAVGQTVAGLAHSIKNILMGLEGGMYIVSKGLKKDDKNVIADGWEMLERNFEKTTSLVKDFLNFSKGRLPELKMVNPNDMVKDIISLYKEIAKGVGVTLEAELDPKIKKAPFDPKGIHTCLTNLVSNAIDACQMSEKKNCSVKIQTKDEKGILLFYVLDDGSGLDYEIKQKIFTTFFTTKGGKGTGLGLLTTKKIIQEHGGKISVYSKKGEGARFKMEFPKKRLYSLYKSYNLE
ncbi:MAG: PAS domain-containing protein [candidate division Zixibacteria bacterium]|nr:PAS domain-containing protein [candidate division Zixibacteria bacterium]